MAISEFEQHKYEKLLQDFCQEQGPPPDLHDKLKWGYEVDPKKQTVELFEIRPRFMEPSTKTQTPIAKARYVKAQRNWKVYWLRGTGKWVLVPRRRVWNWPSSVGLFCQNEQASKKVNFS